MGATGRIAGDVDVAGAGSGTGNPRSTLPCAHRRRLRHLAKSGRPPSILLSGTRHGRLPGWSLSRRRPWSLLRVLDCPDPAFRPLRQPPESCDPVKRTRAPSATPTASEHPGTWEPFYRFAQTAP